MSVKKVTRTKKKKTVKQNPMMVPRVEKVTVNIGVGEAGERLEKAQTVLQQVTHHTSVQTLSKRTNKDLGIRSRMPIGCKVTLRGKEASNFLSRAFETRENRIADYAFDDQGNMSFGIPDHTMFKDQKYDPEIGIFGMDVCITVEKPGYRIKRRRIQQRKIHQNHQVEKKETIKFFTDTFKLEVVK
ncbi:MAG: 50S ribosomal protein L5 [Thermoplasmatota archaeon]